jgi:energy-coupling factor transporter ATP-binding protein EcfA2
MINKAIGQDFKGKTFEIDLGQKTIITGPKGIGKSSVTQAIQLTLLGYVPSEKPRKRPQDIFAGFAPKNAKKFVVGIQKGKRTYRKEFRISPSGSVSQKLMIGTGKYSDVDFKAALKDLPTPYDLSSFMGLSDQKKIDLLFDLFPPAGNVIKLQAEIDAIKDKISSSKNNIDSLRKTVARLSKARSDIEMPPGTLAEIQQEIKRTEAEYRLTSQNIARVEAEAAEAKRQDEKKKAEALKEDPADTSTATSHETQNQANSVEAINQPSSRTTVASKKMDIFDSIQAIIDSMSRAGCDACAAKLVAKREIKRLKEVFNG